MERNLQISSRLQVRFIDSDSDTALEVVQEHRRKLRSLVIRRLLARHELTERTRMAVAAQDNLPPLAAERVDELREVILAVDAALEQLDIVQEQHVAIDIHFLETVLQLVHERPVLLGRGPHDIHGIAQEVIGLAVHHLERRIARIEPRGHRMEQVSLAEPRRPVDEERIHGRVARMFHHGKACLQRRIVAIALDKVLEGVACIEIGTATQLLAATCGRRGLLYHRGSGVRGRKLHLGNSGRRRKLAHTVIYKGRPDDRGKRLAQKFAIVTVQPSFTELIRDRQVGDAVVDSLESDRIENSHSKIIALRTHKIQDRRPGRRR